MAIPFLNNINLSDNQLQNAKLHITGTAPTAAAAQIYFDSSDTIAKYYSNATDTWVSLVQTDFANGTFVSLTNGGTSIKRSYTVDLSAVDGTSTSASRFLTKDNTWATIPFGDVTEVQGGTNINVTDQTGPIPIVNLDDSITLAGTATAVTFLGDLNGTINTATTGTTQSAGDNSTLIATTAYADAAAAAVPIGDYLPLSAGSSYPLTGDLYITKLTPKLFITDTAASNCILEISQQGSTTSFTSRGGTSSTGQFNFRITNGSTTTNALFINQQARATFAGDVIINGGDITLGGTGRIQGVDTVTDGTDATNKTYVDNAISGVPQGTLTGLGEGTYIDIDNTTPAVPIINVEGTEAATASKLVARDSNGYGYVATPASGDSSTKIATTAFVQSSLTGLLEFKGGFNASTGAIVGGGNLTSGATRVAVAVGDYYVVTVDGDFFGNTATPLTVGDSVIVQTAAEAGASVEGDFIVVQSDTDLATETTVGLGNVNIEGAGDKDGLSLSYSAGTATVGLDITSLPYLQNQSTADLLGLEIPLYDGDVDNTNKKIELQDIVNLANGKTTYAETITDTDTITHGLTTKDVIVQLYDVTTNETVYADVERGSTSEVTITFASTPTNSIRVLVQKIG